MKTRTKLKRKKRTPLPYAHSLQTLTCSHQQHRPLPLLRARQPELFRGIHSKGCSSEESEPDIRWDWQACKDLTRNAGKTTKSKTRDKLLLQNTQKEKATAKAVSIAETRWLTERSKDPHTATQQGQKVVPGESDTAYHAPLPHDRRNSLKQEGYHCLFEIRANS